MENGTKKPKKKRKILLYIVLAFFAFNVITAIGTTIDNLKEYEAASTSSKEDDKAKEKSPKREKESTEATKKTTEYKASTYKVGSDIPAGEYVVYAGNGFGGYFEISKDSSGSFESILANENFTTFTIVQLEAGEYFKMTGAYAVPIVEAGQLDLSVEGMFKVGTHISAGEYKISVREGGFIDTGYIEVTSSSRHRFENIVSNDNFEGSKYITVKDGQYLKLSNAVLGN